MCLIYLASRRRGSAFTEKIIKVVFLSLYSLALITKDVSSVTKISSITEKTTIVIAFKVRERLVSITGRRKTRRHGDSLFLREFIVIEIFVVDCIVCFFSDIQVTRQEVKLRATLVVVQLSHHIVELVIRRALGGRFLGSVRHIERKCGWRNNERVRNRPRVVSSEAKGRSEQARQKRAHARQAKGRG
jgi:hypothetical protein